MRGESLVEDNINSLTWVAIDFRFLASVGVALPDLVILEGVHGFLECLRDVCSW